jgi:hypothetical protein
MSAAIDSLLNQRRLWRGTPTPRRSEAEAGRDGTPTPRRSEAEAGHHVRQQGWKDADCIPSGFEGLDARLPGGGWPRKALTEILLPTAGIGELRLLMPALLQIHQARRWIALIAPPYLPYPPAWLASGLDLSRLLWVRPRHLADVLWAAEQALQSGTCGAVLTWPDKWPIFRQLRRLQLAAENGDCLGILFHSPDRVDQATPAALRMKLESSPQGLTVRILKARGSRVGTVMISDCGETSAPL